MVCSGMFQYPGIINGPIGVTYVDPNFDTSYKIMNGRWKNGDTVIEVCLEDLNYGRTLVKDLRNALQCNAV